MGTRNLTIVKAGGEYRVAQYGQWDGYPEGQGRTALLFLLSKARREALKCAATKCTFATESELDAIYKAGEAEGDSFYKTNPQWTRDTGAEILAVVAASGGMKLNNSIKFAGDSLFCEWAYVVDFDDGTFEVYKGFNKRPLGVKARFKNIERRTNTESSKEYYQIRLAKTYKLDSLPTLKKFLADFEGQ